MTELTTTRIDHTAKAFDTDLQEITRKVAEMGGLAERQIADSVQALVDRDVELGERVIATRSRRSTPAARGRGKGHPHHRAPPADGGRSARMRRRHARLQRPRADRRPCQAYRQARRRARRRLLPAKADPRRRAHGGAGVWRSSSRCSTPMPAAICSRRSRSGTATKKSIRCALRCSASSSPT